MPIMILQTMRRYQVAALVVLVTACGRGDPLPLVLDQAPNCNVDLINAKPAAAGVTVLVPGQDIQVTGWAADVRNASVPEKAWVQLISVKTQTGGSTVLQRNLERPDVAQVLGDQKYLKAGFTGVISSSGLAPGDYTLSIAQQTGSDILVCKVKPSIRMASG